MPIMNGSEMADLTADEQKIMYALRDLGRGCWLPSQISEKALVAQVRTVRCMPRLQAMGLVDRGLVGKFTWQLTVAGQDLLSPEQANPGPDPDRHEYQPADETGNPCKVCGFGRHHPWHGEPR